MSRSATEVMISLEQRLSLLSFSGVSLPPQSDICFVFIMRQSDQRRAIVDNRATFQCAQVQRVCPLEMNIDFLESLDISE